MSDAKYCLVFLLSFFNSNAPISPYSNTYCVMGKDIIFIVIERPASALAFSKGKKISYNQREKTFGIKC